MYCKECGKEIDNDSKFCSYCGTKQSLNLTTEITSANNSKSGPTTQNIDIALSFGRPTKKETKDLIKIEKYDRSYQGDSDATIIGIIILIINLVILLTVRIEDPDDQQTFKAIAAIINLIWRILATIWVVNLAKKQNREHAGWGFFAFFIPNLALIIIGLLKKLLNPTSISSMTDLGSNSQESNNISNDASNEFPTSRAVDLDLIKYSILNANTKRSFFKSYDEYTIEFFDNKRGTIYSFDSVQFFINHLDNSSFYYRNKESAIKALYLYLTKKEILKDDLSFSK